MIFQSIKVAFSIGHKITSILLKVFTNLVFSAFIPSSILASFLEARVVVSLKVLLCVSLIHEKKRNRIYSLTIFIQIMSKKRKRHLKEYEEKVK